MSKKKNKNYVLLTLRRNYDFSKHEYVDFKWNPCYYTREQLISRLAISEIYNKEESILNNLSVDMSETSTDKKEIEIRNRLFDYKTWRYRELYFIAKVVGDEFQRVNVGSLVDSVNKKADEIKKLRNARGLRYRAERRCETYTFRYDPVPNVHKYHCHHGSWYRIPQLGRLMRQSEATEYKEFIKGDERKENLPTWDDRPRHNDKSWKTSYKVRKQWQKHVRKHVDTSYYDRKAYDMEWEQEG